MNVGNGGRVAEVLEVGKGMPTVVCVNEPAGIPNPGLAPGLFVEVSLLKPAEIVTLPLINPSVFSPGSPGENIGRVFVNVTEPAPALGPGARTMNVPICVVLVLDSLGAEMVTLPLMVASVVSLGSLPAEIGRVRVTVTELAP